MHEDIRRQRQTSGLRGIGSFSDTRRRWGLTRALYVSVMIRLEKYFGLHVYRVRARPLVETPSLPPLPVDWTVRQVPHCEFVHLVDDKELGLTGDFVNSPVAERATMTAVFEQNRIVSYAFATVGSAPHRDGVWVQCESPFRYSFKSHTRPSHRGMRLSTYTSLCSDVLFMRLGYTHAISFTHTHNFASIRTEASKGNRYIGIAGYLSVRRLNFTFRSPRCRRAGFRFCSPNTKAQLANPA